jgi:hypothetical protein
MMFGIYGPSLVFTAHHADSARVRSRVLKFRESDVRYTNGITLGWVRGPDRLLPNN